MVSVSTHITMFTFGPTHRHCTYHHHSELLQEVLLAVGYFSVLHPDNQVPQQHSEFMGMYGYVCS